MTDYAKADLALREKAIQLWAVHNKIRTTLLEMSLVRLAYAARALVPEATFLYLHEQDDQPGDTSMRVYRIHYGPEVNSESAYECDDGPPSYEGWEGVWEEVDQIAWDINAWQLGRLQHGWSEEGSRRAGSMGLLDLQAMIDTYAHKFETLPDLNDREAVDAWLNDTQEA